MTLEKLRQMRKANGLTQQELAEKAGIPRISLARYELGMTRPNVDVVKKLADTLGVTVDELIDDKKAG